MDAPTTQEVLDALRSRGVIVGSWPHKRDDAKDLDVVILPAKEGRNPVFADLFKRWRPYIESSVVGHIFINAVPMPVEVFEGNGWSVNDEAKAEKQLTYYQAKARSEWLEAYGVSMRAVCGE